MSQSSFVCKQLNDFNYCYLIVIILISITISSKKKLNSSIQPIDGTLTGTATLSQSGSESNGNE